MFEEIVEKDVGDIDVAIGELFESRVSIVTELIFGLTIIAFEITSSVKLPLVIIRASLLVPDNVNWILGLIPSETMVLSKLEVLPASSLIAPVNFTVGFRDGGSSYDATKTTTFFYGYNNEKAKVALDILDDEQISAIKQKMNKGGRDGRN